MIETLLRKLRPWPIHPIDRLYGIETSKRVRWFLFGGATTSPEQRAACLGYAGSQPSVIRKAIAVIPEIAGAHFIDLGCGKGRVVAVATEFPFASIGGVEISPRLVRRARANMKRLARSNPERVSPTITQGDASRPDLPSEGVVVLFLYNPFRAPLVRLLMAHIERALVASAQLRVYVISYNPVQIEAMDACHSVRRFYSAKLGFSPEEIGSSPFGNSAESVVIFQSPGPQAPDPKPSANARVAVTTVDWMAHVEA